MNFWKRRRRRRGKERKRERCPTLDKTLSRRMKYKAKLVNWHLTSICSSVQNCLSLSLSLSLFFSFCSWLSVNAMVLRPVSGDSCSGPFKLKLSERQRFEAKLVSDNPQQRQKWKCSFLPTSLLFEIRVAQRGFREETFWVWNRKENKKKSKEKVWQFVRCFAPFQTFLFITIDKHSRFKRFSQSSCEKWEKKRGKQERKKRSLTILQVHSLEF